MTTIRRWNLTSLRSAMKAAGYPIYDWTRASSKGDAMVTIREPGLQSEVVILKGGWLMVRSTATCVGGTATYDFAEVEKALVRQGWDVSHMKGA